MSGTTLTPRCRRSVTQSLLLGAWTPCLVVFDPSLHVHPIAFNFINLYDR